MRKLVIGIALFFVLGGTALAWPYRIEEVVGEIGDNRTGCTISVQNSSGWKNEGPPSAWRAERLEEPVVAGVAVYECGGETGARPAAMALLVPGGRIEGCASSGSRSSCYARFPEAPAASGTPRQYRLLIQAHPGAPVQTIDITVTRRINWRSGTFDAIMSV